MLLVFTNYIFVNNKLNLARCNFAKDEFTGMYI